MPEVKPKHEGRLVLLPVKIKFYIFSGYVII